MKGSSHQSPLFFRRRIHPALAHSSSIDRLHSITYTVFMKNVTIAMDEQLLREARRIAAERSTSLNAMIREYLTRVTERESQAAHARRRIVELCRESNAEIGDRTWNRDELYER